MLLDRAQNAMNKRQRQIMEKFEAFVDEYLLIVKEGWSVLVRFIENAGWLVFGAFIVIITFPLWLIGKIDLSHRPKVVSIWPELDEAMSELSALINNLNKPK
jgi:hypothetical protein